MTYATDALIAQKRDAESHLAAARDKHKRVQAELDNIASMIAQYEARVASFNDAIARLTYARPDEQ